MANKKIIELDAASQINNDALFVLSQLVGANQKTLKATLAQMQAVFGNVPIETVLTTPVSIASFSDGGDNIPLKALKVLVTAQQAGSGTPAPDNVRAISGWSECNLTRCGKNLLSVNSSTISQADYVLNNVPVILPAGNYVFSFNFTGTGNSSSFRIDDANGNQIFTTTKTISSGTNAIAISLSQVGYVIKFYSNAVGSYSNIQIEKGTSSTTFEPYNGTTHNIPFNTTVYGGVLDVLSGVLTVTHKYMDMGSVEWGGADSNGLHNSYGIADMVIGGYDADLSSFMCEMFTPKVQGAGWANMSDGEFGIANISGNMVFRVKWSNIASGPDFKTFVTGKKMVYKLATPTTIQLTPTEVKTILGQNNIFADCGDIDTLVYFNNNANEISDLVVAYVGDITNLYATLATGNTSLTISNAAIKTTSTIDIYTDGNVDYNTVTVTEGQIVITFDAQASDLKVKVRIS